MLPDGMTMAQAAEGFRNQGQFIAAVNAAHNNNIPFADLKSAMQGDPPLKLGQAIAKLRPAATSGTRSESESEKETEGKDE